MTHTLTVAQKDFIRSTISHLFDLPTEEAALRLEVAKIKEALQASPLEDQHDYAQLQKCYQQPTAYLQRLEDMNADLSVGLVQEYLIDICSQQIEAACATGGIEPVTVEWTPQPYLERLHQPENLDNFNLIFRSQPPAFDVGDHPWQIPVEPEKIFTAQFIPDYNTRQLHVSITIDLPNWNNLEGMSIEFPDDIITDNDEDNFIRELQPSVRENAEKLVGETLLDYLAQKGVITDSQRRRASTHAKKIIAHRFYFNAVLEDKIKFEDLMQLGPKQASNLAEKTIITLMAAGKCDLLTAKNLTSHSLQVLKNYYYFHEVLQDKLDLLAITCASKNHLLTLNLPSVIHLQQKEKISFPEVLTIHHDAIPIFRHPLCVQLFEQNKVTLHDINQLKTEQIALLLDPYYLTAIFNDELSIAEIKYFSSHEIHNLLFPPLILLQKNNLISRAIAKTATQPLCRLLADAFYFTPILGGELTYTQINNLNDYQVSLLLHNKIKQLIKLDHLTVNDALTLKEKEIKILLETPIYSLFQSQKIKLSDLSKIPLAFAKTLERNFFFYRFASQNILTLDEILHLIKKRDSILKPLTQWSIIFGGRVIGIFKDKPYWDHEQVDNLNLLKTDLDNFVKLNPDYSCKEIYAAALSVFSNFLEDYLSSELEKNHGKSTAYARFLQQLALKDEKGDPPEAGNFAQLDRIMYLAKQSILYLENSPQPLEEKPSCHSLSLFSPTANEPDKKKMKSFIQKLEQITSLAKIYQTTENSQPSPKRSLSEPNMFLSKH